MLDALTQIGGSLSLFVIVFSILFCYFGMKGFGLFVQWRCGQCGKLNQSNLITYMLGLCDHMGDYN